MKHSYRSNQKKKKKDKKKTTEEEGACRIWNIAETDTRLYTSGRKLFFDFDNTEQKWLVVWPKRHHQTTKQIWKKKKRDLSLHAIANDDAYSLSLDMHPSPAVSGERQGQGEKKEKADSIAVGKCLSSFKFKQPKMVGVDRG